MAELLEKARALCAERKAGLLFLTEFGGRLYGTDIPGRSDLDVRGVFAPSPQSLLVCAAEHSIHYSSNTTAERNLPQDTDIDLVSVQRWLLEQLPQGDIGAMDLLFAPSHAACTLYRDPVLDVVFANPLRLLDTATSRGYAQYSLGQAKKYGIAGTRLGAFKAVDAYFKSLHPAPGAKARLGDYLDGLLAACGQSAHCSLKSGPDGQFLQLGGKLHAAAVPLCDFLSRLDAELAGQTQGLADAAHNRVDFMALSHALRALAQMEELLRTGRVVFPLHCREEIKAVKQGAWAWPELEARILEQLARVDSLRATAPVLGRYERAFAEQCILACYSPFRAF